MRASCGTSDAGPARELINKHAGLDSRIAKATNSRSKLPHFRPTVDAAVVAAAEKAVAAAEKAADKECDRTGPYCRARQDAVTQAIEKQAQLLKDKATADAIDKAAKELKDLEDQKAALNPVPQTADAAAYRVSKILGKIFDLGPNPVDATADILIYAIAGFAEMITMLGPFIFLTAMSGEKDPAPTRRWWHRRPASPPPIPAAAPETAGVVRTPATPAKSKKRSVSKGAGVREFGSVREWKESRTAARPGTKVKPSDAYAAYVGWSKERGLEPVTLTAFGKEMKGELGIVYEERNKRGFYVGIALAGSPRLAVSNPA